MDVDPVEPFRRTTHMVTNNYGMNVMITRRYRRKTQAVNE